MSTTNTETVTFNRNDWTGRTATMTVDREARTFALNGYTFNLVPLDEPGCDDPEIIALIGRGYSIRSPQWPADYSLGTVWEHRGNASALGMGIDREAGDLYVAAGQLLCNTI